MRITEQALVKLHERAASAKVWGVRLSIKGGGCGGYMYDLCYEEQPSSINDIVYDNVLAVDIQSNHLLEEAILEWQTKGVQEEFAVVNEQAEDGRCGCGESFYIRG